MREGGFAPCDPQDICEKKMAMTVWVALLRAVNVSGVNRLPMAEFRDALEAGGLKGAKTYIQSGNAVFRSDSAAPALATMPRCTI